MKKNLVLLIIFALFVSCNDDSPNSNNNNPYLPSFPVNLNINLNLPQFSDLNFPANGVFIRDFGIRGIVIFYTGSGYNAFDGACPNQELSDCSAMDFKKNISNDPLKVDKTNIVCNCDGAVYSLYSGQAKEKKYPLKQYRVEVNGSNLRVFN